MSYRKILNRLNELKLFNKNGCFITIINDNQMNPWDDYTIYYLNQHKIHIPIHEIKGKSSMIREIDKIYDCCRCGLPYYKNKNDNEYCSNCNFERKYILENEENSIVCYICSEPYFLNQSYDCSSCNNSKICMYCYNKNLDKNQTHYCCHCKSYNSYYKKNNVVY